MRVAVVGAGSIGAQAARLLASDGADVTMYDRFVSPNPWGSHAGESRLIRSLPFLETAPGDRELLADTTAAWRKLERDSGRPLLDLRGCLLLGDGDAKEMIVLGGVAASRRDVLSWQPSQAAGAHPLLAMDARTAAVLDPEGGLIDPREAVVAALNVARAYGARLLAGSPVTAVTPELGGVTVSTEHERALFDRVVVSSGAFSSKLMPWLPVTPRRLLLGWFPSAEPAAFAVEKLPAFAWNTPSGFLYGGPAANGQVKVGIGPRGYAREPTSDRTVLPDDVKALTRLVAEHLPWLDVTRGRFEIHVDGWTPDAHGILGTSPTDERIVLAVGWSGHGFKLSPVIAEVVRRLVAGASPGYHIDHLNPARFAASRGVSASIDA